MELALHFATLVSGIVAVVQIFKWLQPIKRRKSSINSLPVGLPESKSQRPVNAPLSALVQSGTANFEGRRITRFEDRPTHLQKRLNLGIYTLSAIISTMTGMGLIASISLLLPSSIVFSWKESLMAPLWDNPWFPAASIGFGICFLYAVYVKDFSYEWALKNNQFFLISVPGFVFIGGVLSIFHPGHGDEHLSFYFGSGAVAGLLIYFLVVLGERVFHQ